MLKQYPVGRQVRVDPIVLLGEEGCVCNIDIEEIKNDQKTGLFDSNNISDDVKEKIQTVISQVFGVINNAN